MFRYIVKTMYLEKPKHLISWNGGSNKYQLYWPACRTCQYQSLEDVNIAYQINQLGTAVNGPVYCKIWQKTSPIYQSHTTIMLLFGHASVQLNIIRKIIHSFCREAP